MPDWIVQYLQHFPPTPFGTCSCGCSFNITDREYDICDFNLYTLYILSLSQERVCVLLIICKSYEHVMTVRCEVYYVEKDIQELCSLSILNDGRMIQKRDEALHSLGLTKICW